jgi:hypothetical protein
MLKAVVISLALFALAGCRLGVIVTEGGDVVSGTGTRDCAAGSVCEFEINDTNFIDTFTAVAKPGYQFVKWRGGSDFFCGDQVNLTCALSNVGTAGNAPIEAVIASFQLFLIMPIFEFVGVDTDMDGIFDHIDLDDDGDGINDDVDPCPLDPDPLCAPAMVEQLVKDTCWNANDDIGNAVAQSFVAPATGKLTGFSLAAQIDAANAYLTVSQGDITGTVIYQQPSPGPGIDGTPANLVPLVPFVLSTPPAVVSGQQYTIAINDVHGFGLRLCGTNSDSYGGGNAYLVEFGAITSLSSADAAFSVTVE